jgi:xanthine/CO dehydrogenase XdhC/CoxF family maturation factor
MLLTRSGQRAGTVSGGCLEAEVAKKAWWLTASGPGIQRYSSFFDDDSPMPYGLGCGGTVHLLLERGNAAHAVLDVLEANLNERTPFVIVTDLEKAETLLISRRNGNAFFRSPRLTEPSRLKALIEQAAEEKRSFYATLPDYSGELFVEYLAPSPALTIFGAGDDAQPLADFALRLGWHVTVVDGRSNLVRADRFPHVQRRVVLKYDTASPLHDLAIESEDAVVLLTHSYEQDRVLLRELIPHRPRYLGILGPRQRTARLVSDVAAQTGLTEAECMAALHAPVGFDIGAHTPESIALSIVTEIVAVLNGREGMSLKKQPRDHIHAKLSHV